jgi:hypothetical protein
MKAFELDGPQVMAELSLAFAQLFVECNAGKRAADLVERLGLDKTLAWHIAEVAWPQNTLLISEHIPGQEGLDLVLSAAGKRGATVVTIDRVNLAIERLRELTSDHAGDRATLGAMLASLEGVADARSLDTVRRAAYRANVSIFGIRCQAYYHLDVISPNAADPNRLDFAEVRAFIKVARFNKSAAWMLGRARVHQEDKAYVESGTGPLDPDTFARVGAPLIAQFCTQPLPEFRAGAVSQQMVNHYVSAGPLGLSGAVDMVSGEMVRGAGTVFGAHANDTGDVFARLYTPAEWFVQDWLIHNDLLNGPWRGVSPDWRLINELGTSYLYPTGATEKAILPTPPIASPCNAARLGARADIPQAASIIAYACQKLGHTPDHFTAFRGVLSHPPLPATSVFRVVLPQRS